MEKIAIIGCGWLGLHLAKHLQKSYTIICTNTSNVKGQLIKEQGFESFEVKFYDEQVIESHRSWMELGNVKAVLICIPFSRNLSADELITRFSNLTNYLKDFSGQIILMSTIGIYPPTEMEIKEDSLPDQELNQNYLMIEKLITKNFPVATILRLGGLMGANRYLSKYTLAGTEDRVNHVHYQDICNIVELLLRKEITGQVFNVVAPEHPTRNEVLAFQLKKNSAQSTITPSGKIVLSDKIMEMLSYQFIFSDPRSFGDY